LQELDLAIVIEATHRRRIDSGPNPAAFSFHATKNLTIAEGMHPYYHIAMATARRPFPVAYDSFQQMISLLNPPEG
jgi:hypothetical protein